MLLDKLPGLIKEAILDHSETRLRTLRFIKAEFTEYQKSALHRELTEESEFSILRKMISLRKESSKLYREAGRLDLAESEEAEAKIISEFLGTIPSDSEIKDFALGVIGEDRDIRHMKGYIEEVKKKYPNADGKLIGDICKNIILGK